MKEDIVPASKRVEAIGVVDIAVQAIFLKWMYCTYFRASFRGRPWRRSIVLIVSLRKRIERRDSMARMGASHDGIMATLVSFGYSAASDF